MKLEHLVQVLEIARTGSMNKAAANLYISQPNLSTSIKELEFELCTSLFMRTNTGARLTPYGAQFVEYAQNILEQLGEIKDIAKSRSLAVTEVLSIANAHFRYVVETVARLSALPHNRTVRYNIQEGMNDTCIGMVADGDCEVGVVWVNNFYQKSLSHQFRAKNLEFTSLSPCPQTVILGRMNPLHSHPFPYVSIEELEPYPVACYSDLADGQYTRAMWVLGLWERVHFVVNERATLYEILDKTQAFSLGANTLAAYRHAQYYPNIRSLILTDCPVECGVGWIRRKSTPLSPAAAEFVQSLTQLCQVDGPPCPAGDGESPT